MLIGLLVAALLSGCVPIGVRGSSVPLRGAGVGERPAGVAMDDRFAGRMHAPYETRALTSIPGALRNSSHVSEAPDHHRGDPRKQQGADLEAGKVVDAAKTHQDGDRA